MKRIVTAALVGCTVLTAAVAGWETVRFNTETFEVRPALFFAQYLDEGGVPPDPDPDPGDPGSLTLKYEYTEYGTYAGNGARIYTLGWSSPDMLDVPILSREFNVTSLSSIPDQTVAIPASAANSDLYLYTWVDLDGDGAWNTLQTYAGSPAPSVGQPFSTASGTLQEPGALVEHRWVDVGDLTAAHEAEFYLVDMKAASPRFGFDLGTSGSLLRWGTKILSGASEYEYLPGLGLGIRESVRKFWCEVDYLNHAPFSAHRTGGAGNPASVAGLVGSTPGTFSPLDALGPSIECLLANDGVDTAIDYGATVPGPALVWVGAEMTSEGRDVGADGPTLVFPASGELIRDVQPTEFTFRAVDHRLAAMTFELDEVGGGANPVYTYNGYMENRHNDGTTRFLLRAEDYALENGKEYEWRVREERGDGSLVRPWPAANGEFSYNNTPSGIEGTPGSLIMVVDYSEYGDYGALPGTVYIKGWTDDADMNSTPEIDMSFAVSRMDSIPLQEIALTAPLVGDLYLYAYADIDGDGGWNTVPDEWPGPSIYNTYTYAQPFQQENETMREPGALVEHGWVTIDSTGDDPVASFTLVDQKGLTIRYGFIPDSPPTFSTWTPVVHSPTHGELYWWPGGGLGISVNSRTFWCEQDYLQKHWTSGNIVNTDPKAGFGVSPYWDNLFGPHSAKVFDRIHVRVDNDGTQQADTVRVVEFLPPYITWATTYMDAQGREDPDAEGPAVVAPVSGATVVEDQATTPPELIIGGADHRYTTFQIQLDNNEYPSEPVTPEWDAVIYMENLRNSGTTPYLLRTSEYTLVDGATYQIRLRECRGDGTLPRAWSDWSYFTYDIP